MADAQRPRRAPAVERLIGEIKKEDIRVKIFGKISSTENGIIVLQDETGKIRIDTAEKNFEKGAKIIVFGRPVENNKKLEIQAEIIKDATALNENLYKKAHILLSKGGL